jgi:hypothetical protein
MAPPRGSDCMSRPRAATTTHASASDQTPATCAAASSPIEWPPIDRRLYSPRLKQPEQRHLDREQAGLGPHRLVEQLAAVRGGPPARDRLRDRAAKLRVEDLAGRVERLGEHRVRGAQPVPHGDPLRPLPGEHESGLARPAGGSRGHARARLAVGEPCQPAE